MSFLGRAKKFLQDLGTEAPSKTQTFNLACASGHRVRGERTEGYQALRCPACGEGVFVLPRSPLPEPVAPPGVAEARRSRGRGRSPWVDEGPIELQEGQWGGDGAEIIWDDEQEGAPPEGARPSMSGIAPEDLAAAEIEEARRAASVEDRADRPPRRAEGRGASTGAPARRPSAAKPAAARAGRARPERAVAAAPDESPVAVEPRRPRRRGPRVGVIFLLLTVMILATVGWRILKNRRAQYPLIAERGRDEGIPALEAGEFDHAFQLLSDARSAVEGLGGAVDGADEIIQAARESAVFVDLCPESLEDLLAEAGRTGSEDWESKFDKLYKGRYYLFDSFILATPEQGAGGYELGYVVFPPGEATRFGDPGQARPDRFARIDLSDFELFTKAPVPKSKGDPVTFGAKLRSIARDLERKHWVVRLVPSSGVYITHQGALKASGWPDSESVELPREDQP